MGILATKGTRDNDYLLDLVSFVLVQDMPVNINYRPVFWLSDQTEKTNDVPSKFIYRHFQFYVT